ncbi:MAG: 4Fe-4S binding protein [Acidaminococcaceae bacterium]|jgi:Fe-S-cluster-containing hydrogenase component 2|nr:4Fe-4S binding protein [Acidaminococcaceae bacterium]MCI2110135.1 4Fe-4S binding protein [Acidaminococcaceae bacterium]
MYLDHGVVTKEELIAAGHYPSEARMKKGPVAVCECLQKIPCNPCESSCPAHAIHIGENISNLPELCEDKCIGCGSCVVACSGLAIFLLDKSYSDKVGSVSFPYEYLNNYQKGDVVKAADRSGKNVCMGTIKKIITTPKADHTTVVTLEVPIEYVDEVRSIYREK